MMFPSILASPIDLAHTAEDLSQPGNAMMGRSRRWSRLMKVSLIRSIDYTWKLKDR